jgi:CheY-like chemotaxis protein
VDVGPLVQDIVDRHFGLAERFGVQFRARLDVAGVKVHLDPSRFNQALVNLLSNAAKYSTRGDVVDVTARREGSLVRISVSDHGPGIPKEFRSRVFERFARADGSNTRKAGGSGLGLSITKTLIEAFGGAVTFETEDGKGTTFHFLLPAHMDESAGDDGLRRILYLEDDESIAELVSMALGDMAGFDILHCATGRVAVDAVAGFRPQLLLLDVMLPDMDGPQTLAEIRKVKGGGAPVIFMTAKAQVHEQKAYLDLGACAVIAKPFDPLELAEQIRGIWESLPDKAAA